MHAEGIKTHFDLGMALVSDEETGSEKGIKHILAHANPFRRQDIIIVPDAGNRHGTMIEVAEKGILWLKFTTYGQQAHGSTPERGINSFRAAAFLITELNRLYKVFDHEDFLFDTPVSTFEPTKKEANVPNINTIPGEDVFYMDCRILPYYDLDTVMAEIEKRMRKVERQFRVQINVEEVQKNPATPSTPAEAPVVLALQKAIQDIYHLEAKPTGSGGGTVAGLLRSSGYEAAAWSRNDETAHQSNEYCIIENMISDAKVFAHIFLQS